jgi:spermidine/putrescine ABC transporter ATP-binding subunit
MVVAEPRCRDWPLEQVDSRLTVDGSLRFAAIAGTLPGRGAKVSLVNLEKRFQDVGAVCDVSLEIGAGEFLTLLGPSGSGKTTTLMMIAGFEMPSSGDIAIDGLSVVGLPPHKRNIGMVFQNYALFPHLTVAENIAFPLKQRGMNRADRARLVTESLAMMRLPGYEARYPRQLSGGQQQRVALARAIVFQPRLLLMDEPLGALDKQLRESLQLEMRRLHADLGITFIYVTHDQEEALIMSDRIAVMNEGRIAQLGKPEELYDRPCNRFVASFIGESNFLPGVVRGVEDGIVVVDCSGATLRALATGPLQVGAAAMLTMRPERMRFVDPASSMAGQRNRLRATVTEAMFAGERCRYLLRGEDGAALVLKEQSGAGTRRRAIGEMTEIAWSVEDTVVV